MSGTHAFETCVIIGLGYIGLPTSVVVARTGIKVVGVDIKPRVVELVNAGQCPIEEPHLSGALAELVANGRIRAQAEPSPGDVYIIAVQTPFTGGYKPDLSYVEAATRSIAPMLRKGNLVIVEFDDPGRNDRAGRTLDRGAAARPYMRPARVPVHARHPRRPLPGARAAGANAEGAR